MKICYIIGTHTILSQRIAEYFERAGHEIIILCFTTRYANRHPNIELRELGAPKKMLKIPYSDHLDNVVNIKNELKQIKPDIVHGHYISSIASHVSVIDKKYPVVLSAWGSDILIDVKSKHHKILVKGALNRADRITSVSSHITTIMKDMGIPDTKIVTFPFGVDVSLFRPDIDTAQLRAELKLLSETKVLISTRLMGPVYNIETILKAMPEVIEKNPDVKLIMTGSGPSEESLKALTKELGLDKNVIYVGFIEHEELPAYLNLADVYLSSSISDGASKSLLEGMACGVFPVVSDIPANKDWIIHGKNGLLFPAKNKDKLVESILTALDDSSLTKKAFDKNIKLVGKKADWLQNMAELEGIYQSLLDDG